MLFRLSLLLVSAWLSLCAHALPPDESKVVHLKSTTEGVTHLFMFVLQDNQVWIKSRTNNRYIPEWHLFTTNGNPGEHELLPLHTISVDGENVVVVSGRTVYYAKNIDAHFETLCPEQAMHSIKDHWTWKKGLNPLNHLVEAIFGPRELFNIKSIAMSHRGPNVKYFTDTQGIRHPISVGVTTLFLLDKKGNLSFRDPWLPRSHYGLIGPELGEFKVAVMDASASTLFVMDPYGRMRTRLVDFDIRGDNPFFKYDWSASYSGYEDASQAALTGSGHTLIYKDADDVGPTRYFGKNSRAPIALPTAGWQVQPMIPDHDGDRVVYPQISILQVAQQRGNERELRVAGIQNGVSGYFKKMLSETSASAWTFVPTNVALQGNPLSPYDAKLEGRTYEDWENMRILNPRKAVDLVGSMKRPMHKDIAVTLDDFCPDCETGALRFNIDGYVLFANIYAEAKLSSIFVEPTAFEGHIVLPASEVSRPFQQIASPKTLEAVQNFILTIFKDGRDVAAKITVKQSDLCKIEIHKTVHFTIELECPE